MVVFDALFVEPLTVELTSLERFVLVHVLFVVVIFLGGLYRLYDLFVHLLEQSCWILAKPSSLF